MGTSFGILRLYLLAIGNRRTDAELHGLCFTRVRNWEQPLYVKAVFSSSHFGWGLGLTSFSEHGSIVVFGVAMET
jgi:hypothetical protein